MAMDTRRVSYVYSEALISAADALPANEGRASAVHNLIDAFDLLQWEQNEKPDKCQSRCRVVHSQAASFSQLTSFHDPDFINAVLGDSGESHTSSSSSSSSSSEGSDSSSCSRPTKRARRTRTFGLQDDCPSFPAMADYVVQVAGASITAASELREARADIAISWTGGRHHGRRGEAAGFCYVQDIVLAISELRKPVPRPKPALTPSDGDTATIASTPINTTASRIKRVLYLDIDLHHGDGVEEAFRGTSDVLTLSLHRHAAGFFPSTGNLDSHGEGRGAHHALNVPLESGLSSSSLLRIFKSCVAPVAQAFNPDAVVVQCGCDGLSDDPCKEWNLDLEGVGAVLKEVLSWRKKTLLLGGGGYNNANVARCWTYLTAIALDRNLDVRSAIPSSLDDYAAFAPSFTLDVSAGQRSDLNVESTLSVVEQAFEVHAERLRSKYV